MRLAPGTKLGPYEIVAPLGAGGMGEVWRARDPRLGRDVAIKALPAEFERDAERLARFEREAKMLAALSHPNVAAIYGLEEVGGHRFLVLELVEGETLAARVARGPLPRDEAVEIARQVAAAVEAAHDNGVVHRDLKPGNVMLRPDGTVKVLDFGLAKSGDGTSTGSDPHLSASPTLTFAATQQGVILGTAAYMSPEQARGKVVDRRSDIWSFGCVLYELLSGRKVYDGETVSDLVARILEREPDWSALPPGTPAWLRGLLARCLAKDPRQRLQAIGEARIALERGDAGNAAVPAAGARGRGVPWWLAAAIAVALAAVAWVAASRQASPGGPVAVRRLDLVSPGAEVLWYTGPRLSPDGARFAYQAGGRIWVRDLDRLEPRAVAEITDDTPLMWSPDGETIAYAHRRKLWKVPAAGGAPIALADLPGTGNIVGGTWGPDGGLVVASWRGGLYRIPAAGGKPELLLDVDPATQVDFHHPAFLPGGGILHHVHWKDGQDTIGRPRPVLRVLDRSGLRDVAGTFVEDDGFSTFVRGHLLYLRHAANVGIWAVEFDPRSARVSGDPFLVAPGATSLSASNDGSLLYVESAEEDGSREIGYLDGAGRWEGRLGSVQEGIEDPALSPDGTRLAFASGRRDERHIRVLHLARGTETRITFEPGAHMRPRWRDGERLVYSTAASGMRRVLSMRRADGSGTWSPVTSEAGTGLGGSLFEPAGEAGLLHVLDAAGRGELRLLPYPDAGGGEPRRVLRGDPEPNVQGIALSPDRRLLAYVLDEAGQLEVYLTRFPSGDGTWQVSREGGRAPRWDRRTGKLYYVAGVGPSRRSLVEVDIQAAEAVPVGASRTRFELGSRQAGGADFDLDYDVVPGGQRFVAVRRIRPESGREERLVLVEHWDADLDRGGKR